MASAKPDPAFVAPGATAQPVSDLASQPADNPSSSAHAEVKATPSSSDPVASEPSSLKRSAADRDNSLVIKLLVPSRIAGSLIGRGGETIAKLQAESDTFIKLSQPSEFYPGTDARTCMVKGDAIGVKKGVFRVLDTITEQDRQVPPATQTVRIAIPYNAAGSVIGKGGHIVKAIQADTNCHIRLSQKDDPASAHGERVIIVSASEGDTMPRAGIERIVDALINNPEGMALATEQIRYPTVGPRTVGRPPYDPFRSSGAPPAQRPRYDTQPSASSSYYGAYGPGGSYRPATGGTAAPQGQAAGYSASSAYSTGYSGQAASYAAPVAQARSYETHRAPDYQATSYAQPQRASYAAPRSDEVIESSVPEAHVGAVLGKGGSVIREIQTVTGCRVQLGQRGEYIPGTTDRKLIISGGDASGRQQAQEMVKAKIAAASARFESGGGGRPPAPSGYGARPPPLPTQPQGPLILASYDSAFAPASQPTTPAPAVASNTPYPQQAVPAQPTYAATGYAPQYAAQPQAQPQAPPPPAAGSAQQAYTGYGYQQPQQPTMQSGYRY